MTEENHQEVNEMLEPLDKLQATLEQFCAAADVKAVYGEPIRKGDQIIIPAAEIVSALGVGIGGGKGNDEKERPMFGGGLGGGGKILSRPVAVIVAGPEGVRVEPVFDITKVYLAALTAFGFMITTILSFRKRH